MTNQPKRVYLCNPDETQGSLDKYANGGISQMNEQLAQELLEFDRDGLVKALVWYMKENFENRPNELYSFVRYIWESVSQEYDQEKFKEIEANARKRWE